MTKEVRNLIIVAIASLVIGYIVGGVMQTGHCPLSGKVVCKDRAAAYDKMKACCTQTCESKPVACEAPVAEVTDAH